MARNKHTKPDDHARLLQMVGAQALDRLMRMLDCIASQPEAISFTVTRGNRDVSVTLTVTVGEKRRDGPGA